MDTQVKPQLSNYKDIQPMSFAIIAKFSSIHASLLCLVLRVIFFPVHSPSLAFAIAIAVAVAILPCKQSRHRNIQFLLHRSIRIQHTRQMNRQIIVLGIQSPLQNLSPQGLFRRPKSYD